MSTTGNTGVVAVSPAEVSVGPAVDLGWLLAQMYLRSSETYRDSSDVLALADPVHLASVTDLGRVEWMHLAFGRLDSLIEMLKLAGSVNTNTLRENWAAGEKVNPFRAALNALNLAILDELVGDGKLSTAYQFGRELSDTCFVQDETHDSSSFLRKFDRTRLASLRSSLGLLGDALPAQSAMIVGRSLQNWQVWADANAGTLQRHWSSTRNIVLAALNTQAEPWKELLVGERNGAANPGIEAWLYAAESTVRTMRTIVSKVLLQFKLVALVFVIAVAGLLFASIDYSHGTAKVWTSLLTVAGGLGISGASIGAGTKRASGAIEQSISHAAELDARAWAVTWLPVLELGLVRRQRLSRAGLPVPKGGRRLEGIENRPNRPRSVSVRAQPEKQNNEADPVAVVPNAPAS